MNSLRLSLLYAFTAINNSKLALIALQKSWLNKAVSLIELFLVILYGNEKTISTVIIWLVCRSVR